MKNPLIILLAITAFITCSTEAIAQYAIPSYNVSIVVEPTTFKEGEIAVTNSSSKPSIFSLAQQNNKARRDMYVQASSSTPGEGASAVVVIYSLDGEDELGPFTVTDQQILVQEIDEREWGVRVQNASENCEISTWIQ